MKKDKRNSYDVNLVNNKSLVENPSFSNNFAKFIKKPTLRIEKNNMAR